MEEFDAMRRAEQDSELEALGAGRGLAGPKSADPEMADLRAMAEDPVLGRGKQRWAGLHRPEEAAEVKAKADRQADWEASKSKKAPGRFKRGLHKMDKLTGRGGLDVARRYASKTGRAIEQTAHLGPVGAPTYKGKGAKSFFDSDGAAGSAGRTAETLGRRALGGGIWAANRFADMGSAVEPIFSPVIGVARDMKLAHYEFGKAEEADDMATETGSDKLTRSLAIGSRERHKQRRDDSALKAGFRGGLAPLMVPGLASAGASVASTIKSGVDHLRSDARKTRLAAAGGSDDALLGLGAKDQDFRRAMLEYLDTSERGPDELATSNGLSAALHSEMLASGTASEDLKPDASSGSPAKGAIALDTEFDEDAEDESEVHSEVEDTLSTRGDAEHDLIRLGNMDRTDREEEIARHAGLMSDLKGSQQATRGIQEISPGMASEGSAEHTLRPSMTAKRSSGEAARRRQRERMGEKLGKLTDLEKSAWYDSRKKG